MSGYGADKAVPEKAIPLLYICIGEGWLKSSSSTLLIANKILAHTFSGDIDSIAWTCLVCEGNERLKLVLT